MVAKDDLCVEVAQMGDTSLRRRVVWWQCPVVSRRSKGGCQELVSADPRTPLGGERRKTVGTRWEIIIDKYTL